MLFLENYPFASPDWMLIEKEYNTTPFMNKIMNGLYMRMAKLPKLFSLSYLLYSWELAVRTACAPSNAKGSLWCGSDQPAPCKLVPSK